MRGCTLDKLAAVPGVPDPKSRANSLSCYILQAIPCGSISYAAFGILENRKSNEISTLEQMIQKKSCAADLNNHENYR
jgi:hypothetical protein